MEINILKSRKGMMEKLVGVIFQKMMDLHSTALLLDFQNKVSPICCY